jgi:RNA polymerase sigma factor (sigma-70 family)
MDRHFAALAVRAERDLPRSLRRRVGVADVLQETLLAAYSRREEFENRRRRALRIWLLGILDNKVREAIRYHAGTARRALGREESGAGRVLGVPVRSPSPLDQVFGTERLRHAAEALARLPPHYREVIRLRRDAGLGVAETARRLGRTPDAVKKLCGRALASRQRLLDGHGAGGRAPRAAEIGRCRVTSGPVPQTQIYGAGTFPERSRRDRSARTSAGDATRVDGLPAMRGPRRRGTGAP